MKAIETAYKGYRFRSRLEARWAVFFDVLGLAWVYEKEGYILSNDERYLPDFWFPALDCFAEVKPTTFTQTEYDKCEQLPKFCLLLDTATPEIYRGYYLCTQDIGDTYPYYKTGDDFSRVLLEPSVHKGRLWFLFGEKPEDYWMDLKPQQAARSARFEYGESGYERYATFGV